MTKKHFKQLAEVISKVADPDTKNILRSCIGDVCANVNPRFNWDKWNKACYAKGDNQ